MSILRELTLAPRPTRITILGQVASTQNSKKRQMVWGQGRVEGSQGSSWAGSEQARLDQALREDSMLKGDFSSLPQRPPTREGFAPGDPWQCLEAYLAVTVYENGSDGGATGI